MKFIKKWNNQSRLIIQSHLDFRCGETRKPSSSFPGRPAVRRRTQASAPVNALPTGCGTLPHREIRKTNGRTVARLSTRTGPWPACSRKLKEFTFIGRRRTSSSASRVVLLIIDRFTPSRLYYIWGDHNNQCYSHPNNLTTGGRSKIRPCMVKFSTP